MYNIADLKGWFARSKMFAWFFRKILKAVPFLAIRSKMFVVAKNAEQFRSASENQRFSLVFFVFRRFSHFFKNRTPCKTCRSDRSFSLYGVDSDWKNGYLRQYFRACLSEKLPFFVPLIVKSLCLKRGLVPKCSTDQNMCASISASSIITS